MLAGRISEFLHPREEHGSGLPTGPDLEALVDIARIHPVPCAKCVAEGLQILVAALMEALNACNRRFGRGDLVPGGAGFAPKREWSTKFEMRSPRYTTRLDELTVVLAA